MNADLCDLRVQMFASERPESSETKRPTSKNSFQRKITDVTLPMQKRRLTMGAALGERFREKVLLELSKQRKRSPSIKPRQKTFKVEDVGEDLDWKATKFFREYVIDEHKLNGIFDEDHDANLGGKPNFVR